MEADSPDSPTRKDSGLTRALVLAVAKHIYERDGYVETLGPWSDTAPQTSFITRAERAVEDVLGNGDVRTVHAIFECSDRIRATGAWAGVELRHEPPKKREPSKKRGFPPF